MPRREARPFRPMREAVDVLGVAEMGPVQSIRWGLNLSIGV